jgi:hypothetical protein
MALVDVAVVGFAHHATDEDIRSEQEMLLPVIREALAPSGLDT